MGKTTIAWTEKTWNPIASFDLTTGKRGWFCERVSPGCTNCYASARNVWIGNGHSYKVPERKHVEPRIVEKQLTEPLRWKEPTTVFPCSMTDLFYEQHTDAMIDRVFAVMAATPQHTYQVLTKRPERAAEYFRGAAVRASLTMLKWPLPNVWMGVSAEDQPRADERIPQLLLLPAAVRWVSYEPALGPVVLPDFATGDSLHWIVIGGESGMGARPFQVAWARSMVQQCRERGIAPFVKQLGARPISDDARDTGGLHDAKGEDPSEWAEDLRVREYPGIFSTLSDLPARGTP